MVYNTHPGAGAVGKTAPATPAAGGAPSASEAGGPPPAHPGQSK